MNHGYPIGEDSGYGANDGQIYVCLLLNRQHCMI